MKRTILALAILLAGCGGQSLEEMKAIREELQDRVLKLKLEVHMLENVTTPGFDADNIRKLFTEDELKMGYARMINARVDEIAELEPRLEEIKAKVDRKIRGK